MALRQPRHDPRMKRMMELASLEAVKSKKVQIPDPVPAPVEPVKMEKPVLVQKKAEPAVKIVKEEKQKVNKEE